MPRRNSLLTVAALAAALAAPSGALAQSAGDDQYTDPFQGEEPANQQQEQEQEPSTPPATEDEAAPDTGVAPSTEDTPAATENGATLPLSGLPALVLVGVGAGLLLAGAGLRRFT